MIKFEDRAAAYPGRIELTEVGGSGATKMYTLARADQPTKIGTPLNAATFNALFGAVRAAKVTLDKNAWQGAGPYTQTVTVDANGEALSWVTADWVPGNPTIDPGSSPLSVEARDALRDACACLTGAVTAAGAIQFVCDYDKPAETLTITVPGALL